MPRYYPDLKNSGGDMQRHFIGLVLVFTAATAFGEDVTPPATSTTTAASATATASTATATTTAVTTSADKPKNSYNGYKLVQKEGKEDKYCRKQKLTGSRTKVVETCLTLEEYTVMRESGQSVVLDAMRNQGTSVQGVNTGNGSQPSAVSF